MTHHPLKRSRSAPEIAIESTKRVRFNDETRSFSPKPPATAEPADLLTVRQRVLQVIATAVTPLFSARVAGLAGCTRVEAYRELLWLEEVGLAVRVGRAKWDWAAEAEEHAARVLNADDMRVVRASTSASA